MNETLPPTPAWMSREAIETLGRGYLLPGETPRSMFERVAKATQKYLPDTVGLESDVFEMFWRGFIGGASPVLSNFGVVGGALPVSCYSNHISDSVASIYSHLKEVAALSQNGGGVGSYFGDIRPAGAPFGRGGRSIGAAPWMRQYDRCSSTVSQGGVRRGSFALYLPIDHPDLPEVLRAKDHSQGDPRQFIDSNIAVTVTNGWLESMIAGDSAKQAIFGEILKSRLICGSPYIIFIDNVNDANPQCYKERNLDVKLSNLCSEITLHTDEQHTFVCVLSSLNLALWEEWKNWRGPKTKMSAPELAIYVLDAVVSEFIFKAERITSLGRAVRFAQKSRALGLGTMGLHSLYQSKMLPFGSDEARALNIQVHEAIKAGAVKASQALAKEYGEPEWCVGSGQRHTHLMAIAPTKSNSVICGAGSEGIEPVDSNYFPAVGAKGTFVRKNAYLAKHLAAVGQDSDEVWDTILEDHGSVRNLDFMDSHTKAVFQTAREIDQFEILRQAADRQKFVCQAQSINLFVDPEISAEEMFRLHLTAWKLKLKSLYYLKSSSLLVSKKPLATKQAKIVTKPGCPYCVLAKNKLKADGYVVQEIDLSEVPKSEWHWKTVPQIWKDGVHIGGYDSLTAKAEPTYNECVACEG